MLEKINSLGISLFSGTHSFAATVDLTDDNFFDILNMDKLESNIDIKYKYFQTNQISNYLYAHLQDDHIKNQIIAKNPYKDRYRNNRDCFVHIRLGDTAIFTPGIEYYLTTLSQLPFEKLHIGTDDISHPMIQAINIHFSDRVNILKLNDIETIQFGSTNKYIVLSHGSYSAICGYLSFFSDVYYPEYNRASFQWFSDIFSIPGWHKS